jgi:membrane associated rhomboid family serine protease
MNKAKSLGWEILKITGAMGLLVVLMKGIYGVITSWVPKGYYSWWGEDGSRVDYRAGITGLAGFALWLWILYCIKRSRMTPEERKQDDSTSAHDPEY